MEHIVKLNGDEFGDCVLALHVASLALWDRGNWDESRRLDAVAEKLMQKVKEANDGSDSDCESPR